MNNQLCRKPLCGSSFDYSERGWFYCGEPSGHEKLPGYEQQCKAADPKVIPERPVRTLGDEVKMTTEGVVAVDVWRTVVIDGKPTGLCDRDKGRTTRDIARDVREILTAEDMIDESFSDISDWGNRDVDHAAQSIGEPFKSFKHPGKWELRWRPPMVRYGDEIFEVFETAELAKKRRAELYDVYRHRPEPLPELPGHERLRPSLEWPADVRWIACYAVTGGSEGHYVHVDVIHDCQHTAIGSVQVCRGMFMSKTFRGIEHATKLAARIAQILGA